MSWCGFCTTRGRRLFEVSLVLEGDIVDGCNRSGIDQMIQTKHGDDRAIEGCLLFVSGSRQLECSGDHATNTAEDAIELAEGEVVRHTCLERGRPESGLPDFGPSESGPSERRRLESRR